MDFALWGFLFLFYFQGGSWGLENGCFLKGMGKERFQLAGGWSDGRGMSEVYGHRADRSMCFHVDFLSVGKEVNIRFSLE